MDESSPSLSSTPPPDAPDDEAPDFTPVPSTRNRHDGWTAQRQSAFLVALAKLGLVSAAARSVGMTPRTAYRLRARDTLGSFSAAWDDALEDGRRSALDAGVTRAIDGELVPVYYHGRKVGETRRFDNRLLIAALYATISLAERAAMARATARDNDD